MHSLFDSKFQKQSLVHRSMQLISEQNLKPRECQHCFCLKEIGNTAIQAYIQMSLCRERPVTALRAVGEIELLAHKG